jgi:multidrug efflux pump
MLPLATIAQVQDTTGPVLLMRYNMYSAAAINGDTLPGVSSGDAIREMEKIAEKDLPRAMAFEWTELTYMQLEAGNTALYVFGLAVVFVFLVLAAQYESWSLPLAVILVVPMCLLCSIAGVALATEACRLRLRPIMMTSFAFILGVVPLVIAEGAGAEMRRTLGTAVFSGMLGVTLFGIFLTPVFFYVIMKIGRGGKDAKMAPAAPSEAIQAEPKSH